MEPEDHRDSADFGGVVLAAGRGSRMVSDIPKVLLAVGGMPMVARVFNTLAAAGVDPICVVISPSGDAVRAVFGGAALYAEQREPLGSGDAAAAAASALAGRTSHVVVACGDSPLFRTETVHALTYEHVNASAAITLAAARLEEPAGYGRIIRDETGRVVGVVEEKAATAEQRELREVNGGLYAFDAGWLWRTLAEVKRAPGREFVLTELVAVAVREGRPVASVPCSPEEMLGVNTPDELRRAESILERRIAQEGAGRIEERSETTGS